MLTACFTEHGFCSHSDRCNVREPLRKVHEGILKLLSSITIFDMSHDECSGPELDVENGHSRLYGLTGTPAEGLRNKTI